MNDFKSFKSIDFRTPVWQQKLSTPTRTISPASIKITKEPEKKSNHNLVKIMIISAVAGLAIFKGLTYGPVYKHIEKYANKLDDKIFDLTNKSKSLSFLGQIYLSGIKKIRQGLSLFNSLTNFTAIKDTAWKKFSNWKPIKFLGKLSDSTTNLFKKIVNSALDKNCQRTMATIDSGSGEINKVIEKLMKKLPAEELAKKVKIGAEEKTVEAWLKLAQEQTSELTQKFLKGFSVTARTARIKSYDQQTANLTQEVIDTLKKEPFNLKKFKSYITADLSAERIRQKMSEVFQHKNSISHNIDDIYEIASETVGKITEHIEPSDQLARTIMRSISKDLKNYQQLSGSAEAAARNKIVETINTNLQKLSQHYAGNLKPHNTLITAQINILKDTLNNSQKGSVEEILTILRSVTDKKSPEYTKALLETGKIKKALKETVKLENTLYNKYAELNVGSAPTDVLGLLVPTVTGAVLVSKSKDKEELIGSTLKQGVPIVGGVATCIYCTTKMKTGLYGLAAGIISSLILNRIGDKINDLYKKFAAKQKFTDIAIAEYRKMLAAKKTN